MLKHFLRMFHFGAVAILPALLIFVPVREAKAQLGFGAEWCTNCADEPTALISKATQLMQYIKEAETALQAVQLATMMTREVKQLVTHPSTNILQDLAVFSNVLVQSQGLALDLARTDASFRQNFQMTSPSPLVDYASQYNKWASTALNSLHASANSAGYQGNMLNNEQQFMAQMNQLNQQSNGQDQSLQIANSIGIEEVAQLQKLRMLMISNMQSNAAFSTAQLNSEQMGVTTTTAAFTPTNWVADPRSW
jgi:P-type conjugative transfer protein TrbJ